MNPKIEQDNKINLAIHLKPNELQAFSSYEMRHLFTRSRNKNPKSNGPFSPPSELSAQLLTEAFLLA